jgi:hypothetical protein
LCANGTIFDTANNGYVLDCKAKAPALERCPSSPRNFLLEIQSGPEANPPAAQRSAPLDPGLRQTTGSPLLSTALGSLARHPLAALLEGFNWKTAIISAVLRATLFFFTNLRSGSQLALRATLVEAAYAICASGLLGAVTERIRGARPEWLTGLTVWVAMPVTLLTAQFFVHRFFGTPRLGASMVGSFCFAALGTGFNWFAMRRGAMMVGADRQSFTSDLRALPAIIWAFVTAIPRALASQSRRT